MKLFSSLFVLLICEIGFSQTPLKSWKVSNMLTVHQITPSVYLHETKLVYQGDSVGCNGIVYAEHNMGVMVDTPSDSATTDLLIRFFKDSLHVKIATVLVTHFHIDALGGLNACHTNGIHSQGYWTTTKLAEKEDNTPPKSRVKSSQTMLDPDGRSAIFFYPGQGHTKDNAVVYLPAEKVLFGGCLVKCLDANYGNVADANIKKWPETIRVLKEKFPDAEIVIPGHGAYGDQALLDYTIQLFENYEKP